NRITDSIYSYIMKRRRIKYGVYVAAASVVVMLSIRLFNNTMHNTSPIENFVKTLGDGDIESLQNVKLILNDNQNIEIVEENTAISYSNTGQEVKIGNSKSVYQNPSKSKKIVFNTLIVPYGKRSEIELADGSKVWLNSGSKLVFPSSFTGSKREVYLEGEAIFEVAHDKTYPFIVKANSQEIEVLGTVFNVSNYANDNLISTVLKSGSVQINFKDNAFNKNIRITPGELAVYNKVSNTIQTKIVEVEKYFSWRDGIFIFKDDSLRSIMKKVSKYYNINIVINNEDLANQEFSGLLDIKDNVEGVLSTIQETTEFQYNITIDNKIIIN
ncbi:MAG: FecR domain-containing protein, partial [Oleispira sp.]|nr:FecR domain-containing protein [Oleispira sp.]